MTKFTPISIQSGYLSTTQLNANFASIANVLDNQLDRTGVDGGSSGNSMQTNLDMNGNHIINLPTPTLASDPIRLQDASSFLGLTGTTTVPPLVNGYYLTNNGTTLSWAPIQVLPSFVDGKYLTNNGSAASWSTYTLSLGGNFTTSSFVTFSGVYSCIINLVGNTNITLPQSGIVPNIQQVISGSSGFTNKIINGMMDISQRGTSGTLVAGTETYTIDRWRAKCTGANVTWNIINTTIFGATNWLFFNGASSNTDVYIKQRIESYLAAQLANPDNESVIILFQAAIYNNTGSSITPKLTVNVPTAKDNYTAVNTSVNAASLQSCGNSSFTQVAYAFSIPGSISNGMEVILDFGAVGNGQNVAICAVDVRAVDSNMFSTGLVSNPPYCECRPITIELQLCQRYFCKSFSYGTAPAQNAGLTGAITAISVATSFQGAQVFFPQTMRTIPTFTLYNPSNTNANWRDTTGNVDLTSASTNLSEKDVFLYMTVGVTSGHTMSIHYTADADL